VHYIDPISQPEFPPPPFTPAQPPAAQGDPAKVDLLDVLLIVAVTIVASLLTSFAALAIYWLNHKNEHLTPEAVSKGLAGNALYLVGLQLGAYLIIVGFMALLTWGRHRVTLGKAISWKPPATARQVWYALAGGLALALISDIGNVVLNRWIPKSLPFTELFKDRPSALLLAGFGILIAPIVEEIAFRGFLYPALARFTGALPSIFVTAALFTLLHGAQLSFSWAPLLLIFIVGFTLTTVRARTNSVALCVIVHMTYNFVLLAQTFIATHGFRQMQGV
jgi:membrane protease YdiL (CAAX protease family)